jgi:DNA-binding NarL/FixJ family response regulator
VPTVPADIAVVDDHTLVRQGVGAFLKVFDDIKLREDAARRYAHHLPDIVVIDEDEFKKRLAEQEVDRQRRKHIGKLFNSNNEEKSE